MALTIPARGGGGHIDVALAHTANGQIELERITAVECGGAVGKVAAGGALRQGGLQHFDAVAAGFSRAAGCDAKSAGLGVAGLDRAEIAGVVEFAKGIF